MTDRLGMIMSNTLNAIESSKEEIFYIAETTRAENERLTQESSQLKGEILRIIEDVDKYQKLERRFRQRLMEVSRDLGKYSEKVMMDTYTQAKDVQVQLQLLQSKEIQLRNRRDEIERSLKQMEKTIERAESLLNQVTLAINLLHGGIAELSQNNSPEHMQETALKIIRAQDEERRRIAREIHDGPAQNLANIVLRLEIAEKLLALDPSRVRTEISDLKGLVRANLQDIRRIIFDLRPIALDQQGFITALERYLINFQETYSLICDFQVLGKEKQLLPAIEVAIFRSLQEGMTNIAKHAHTNWARVLIVYEDSQITIQITDRGNGFNVEEAFVNPGDHFGLIGMKERIEMFKGQMKIRSSHLKGTTVKLIIPTSKEEGWE
ncbi:histidine kinase [Desulfitobacterium dichloroeliminans LMG P-21439]|uniref:histidine kinase n=1 Tax=Desulfitobacterium dichloroeliminans (strain LMG P-21439 / DCA1) TaxID=871963 RepID=L0F8S8_DESDL|nr:sensor histidine kinase [Desulfitobacterium dichloroeliminans]AGA69363.1 histidine kinase [Desulfitobacterium dichloroeliminans LMG P-21439]